MLDVVVNNFQFLSKPRDFDDELEHLVQLHEYLIHNLNYLDPMKVAIVLFSVLTCVFGQGFYQNSDVIELTPDSFNQVILGSNYTSVVEFYAPWCGHCNNFKGAYRKTGKILKDIITVGAVNCDLDINKPLCGRYQVEGFPTVKIFRPPKYLAKHPPESKKAAQKGFADEQYNGERTAKALVGFSQTRVKSYVKRIFDLQVFEQFVVGPKFKAVVFSDSKKPSLFLKSLAIDYLGIVNFAYFDFKGDFKESDILKRSGISKITKPALLVFNEDSTNNKLIEGGLTKEKFAEVMLSTYGVKPVEGPGSEKYDIIKGLKKGKTLKEMKKSKSKSKSKKEKVRDEF